MEQTIKTVWELHNSTLTDNLSPLLRDKTTREIKENLNEIMRKTKEFEDDNMPNNPDNKYVHFDVFKLIKDIVRIYKHEVEKKSIELDVNCNWQQLMYGEREKLTIILIQLIDNAIKFTTHWKIKLICDSVVRQNNIDLTIIVLDSWPWIENNTLNEILYIDHKEWPESNKQGGWLKTIIKFIDEIWWDIFAESSINNWTAFTLHIPCKVSKAI